MKMLSSFMIYLIFALPISAGIIKGKITIKIRTSIQEEWVVAPTFNDAVIFITGLEEEPLKNKSPIFHNQINKNFFPRILPLTQGDRVTFRNKDPINHNVFSLSKGKPFDLGLFKAPVEKSITFDKPGLIKIFCNIHPEMIATFLVLKNNKYFRTQADGLYMINNIPSGKYKLKVWVEGTKLVSQNVVVTDSSNETFNFEIKALNRPLRHLNKFGKPYKKY